MNSSNFKKSLSSEDDILEFYGFSAKHSQIEVKTQKSSSLTTAILSIAILILLSFAYLHLNSIASKAHLASPRSAAHLSYRKMLIDQSSVLLWVEFERNGTSQKKRKDNFNYKLKLNGFRRIQWQNSRSDLPRKSGRIAFDSAYIELNFPRAKDTDLVIEEVSLFFLDHDSRERVAKLSSGSHSTWISSLHEGRWVNLPVSVKERFKGFKSIELKPLIGSSAPLLAVAIKGGPSRNES